MGSGKHGAITRAAHSIGRCRGFTLVEVVTVSAMLAVLAAMAAPSFAAWHRKERIESSARALLASFAYARSEAMRRADIVVVCPVAAAGQCERAGGRRRGDRVASWSSGWAVMAGEGERRRLLRGHTGLRDVAILGSAANVRFTPPAGQVVGGFRSFEVMGNGAGAYAHGEQYGRCIAVAAGGRARIAEGRCGARA
ncbi:GspH/FimT family pseudopilin [Trinickia caryophylli]|uniref:Type II secretion system protein H n=1 Tax=Trinickia caryophylli TaxID=28094 RepID=A0A1X7CEX1_TRICW|nr:GspH/FimT family pseudopilin [Trinickia caryophylli]PMS11630.1 prepilin-type N-terminal cleavage/methylation domain-containing protein [Trinickia caryophylli]TRX19811.1 prepilin-type N-terminal cleavage/methylation domain-containing protein [Trinickia caryophylli]WQE12860.1 GspH/FimT family pseudopilin [Trinickia caryophylli]SME95471.1 type IV fimbrial biogenesis protein FimT [Trinickia caryophylli]GLU30582.1 hypothetical protein Busp01_04240 [Trinickia caryophylli]